MKIFKYPVLIFLFPLLASCSGNDDLDKPAIDFKFQIENQTVLTYESNSVFYHEKSDSIRFRQSAEIKNTLLNHKERNGTLSYQFELLPGWSVKELADTMVYEVNEKGVFCHYNKQLFEGSDKSFLLIPFPLTKGKKWETKFFSYPATAECSTEDTIIITKQGQFHCFRVDYSFTPDYMNSFIKDSTQYEVKAIMSDFFSKKGKVLSRINYYMTERIRPVNRWKILESQTMLINIHKKD